MNECVGCNKEELLRRTREYVDEGEHSGDVPSTIEEFVNDLRLWLENYDG